MCSSSSVRLLAPLPLVLALACAGDGVRRFPLTEPLWVDAEDFRPFEPPPEEYFSPFGWDGADQMLFRPFARFFAVDPAGESTNVNAMDEVPDSSWYTNRLSRGPMAMDVVLQGSCTEPPLDPAGPWTVTNAKPNGANPGFIMEDAEGRKFLLKFDSPLQPERATAADVMGSLFYYAAGYFTPCNRTVFFDPSILRIEEGATLDVAGEEVPMTLSHLAPIFERASRHADGQRVRAASSAFLPGRPLGPWRYEGTRDDDPNDVVPHEDRRELRGGYVLASWINHFDAREQNTLSMWITEGEGDAGHVRHNYIDFGDSFGSQWDQSGISRRLGHASYFDLRTMLVDFATLGLVPRAWHHSQMGPSGDVLGYFDVETFVPDRYRPGYPNPAFSRSSERDNAWMARILALLDAEQVAAIVEAAQVQDDTTREELVRILLGRRERILRRWLRRLSPLTWPRVVEGPRGPRLCATDLVIHAGLHDWDARPYWARAWRAHERDLEAVPVGALARVRPDGVCVDLPSIDDARQDAPAYLIVDLMALYDVDDDQSRPLRVHLYQLGPRAHQVVGVERPYSLAAPGPRDS